jgi:2-isopropylmalate synthase
MHVDGVYKNASAFEHIDPAAVGNRRRILISEVAGWAAVLPRIQRIYPEISLESPVVDAVVKVLKEKECAGYSYEGANASFELLVRNCAQKMPCAFELVGYQVLDQLPYGKGKSATATLKIRIGMVTKITAAEGDGPVNALDIALREALAAFYPVLRGVRLLDYKVRIMESKGGTGTRVRVLITSGDAEGNGPRWECPAILLKPAGKLWPTPWNTACGGASRLPPAAGPVGCRLRRGQSAVPQLGFRCS